MHPALIAYLLILAGISILAMRDDIVHGGKVFSSLLGFASLVLEVAMVLTYQFSFASATVILLWLFLAAATEIHLAQVDLQEVAAEPLPFKAVGVGLWLIVVGPAYVMGTIAYRSAA